jgi:hypothetical protein
MATTGVRTGFVSREELYRIIEGTIGVTDDQEWDLSLGDTVSIVAKVLPGRRCSMSFSIQKAANSDEGNEAPPDSVHKVSDYFSIS